MSVHFDIGLRGTSRGKERAAGGERVDERKVELRADSVSLLLCWMVQASS